MPTKFVLSWAGSVRNRRLYPKIPPKSSFSAIKISKKHFDIFLHCANVPFYNVASSPNLHEARNFRGGEGEPEKPADGIGAAGSPPGSVPAQGVSPYDDVLVQKATQRPATGKLRRSPGGADRGLEKGEPHPGKGLPAWVRPTVSCSIIPRPRNTWKRPCA